MVIYYFSTFNSGDDREEKFTEQIINAINYHFFSASFFIPPSFFFIQNVPRKYDNKC